MTCSLLPVSLCASPPLCGGRSRRLQEARRAQEERDRILARESEMASTAAGLEMQLADTRASVSKAKEDADRHEREVREGHGVMAPPRLRRC